MRCSIILLRSFSHRWCRVYFQNCEFLDLATATWTALTLAQRKEFISTKILYIDIKSFCSLVLWMLFGPMESCCASCDYPIVLKSNWPNGEARDILNNRIFKKLSLFRIWYHESYNYPDSVELMCLSVW